MSKINENYMLNVKVDSVDLLFTMYIYIHACLGPYPIQ